MTTIRKPTEVEVVNYWKYVLQHPANQNSMIDHDGRLSLQGQNPSSNMVFLSGNTGGTDKRKIPGQLRSGQAIFVAVNPVVIMDPEIKPNEDIKQVAKNDEDTAEHALLTINGEAHNLKSLDHRIQPEIFEVDLPANAMFNCPRGKCKAAADGYYAVIEGVPSGDDNTIELDGKVSEPYEQDAPWESKVTYTFKVQ